MRYRTYTLGDYHFLLERELESQRCQAFAKLSTVVSKNHIEQFAKILSYGWAEECPEALKVAKELNLDKKDFIAIANDEKAFEKLMLEEMEYNVDADY